MSDLEQLKALLFGAEKAALDTIAQRVEQAESRTVDVADVLPEAVYQSHRNGDDLVDALSAPVGECLKREFRDDPQTYGDALYPVMGPAIRKSIVHALRNVAQQINTAVEHSITPKGLKWRWQASRAGVPFGEYVLQQTLQYRVEQAYLISRDNGLLISHVHHQAAKIKDSDAVSAMFTAIQDFVKESFSPDRTGRLESADMGEFTLWAMHGPHALLVCVIRGVPPNQLRGELSATLERIHFRHGDAIRGYKGDTSKVTAVETDLERCLRFEGQREQEDRSGRGKWLPILGLLLLTAAAFWIYKSWQSEQRMNRLAEALAQAPGIHVTDLQRRGGLIEVRGLRDPLADEVTVLVERAGLSTERVTVAMQPFQSLDTEIIEARARGLLEVPQSATIQLVGGTLVVEGEAPFAWQRQLSSRYRQIAGINSIDVSSLSRPPMEGLQERAANLDDTYFTFSSGITFADGVSAALAQYATALETVARESRDAGMALQITVIGETDALGSAASNLTLAQRRAEAVASVLSAKGLDVRLGEHRLAGTDDDEGELSGGRRARVLVELVHRVPPR
ncbi:MAG: OmpA family protein [Pseudomonadota bacterium]